MPPFLATLSIRDYIIAGLASLCLLLALNTYLDVHLGPVGFEGWKPRAERLQGTIDQFAKAQKEAGRLAQEAHEKQEAEYRDKAKEADHEHETTLARVDDATDRYIASHRVCPTDRGPTGTATASPTDNGPGVPEGVPADPIVAVAGSDVRTCSALYAYALSARAWAVSLEKGD